MPVLEGIQYGLVLALIVGPSFFYLVRVSIRHGFGKAAAFTLGILTSDLILIIAIFFGFSQFFEQADFKILFSFIAGGIILFLGIRYLLKGRDKNLPLEEGHEEEEAPKKTLSYVLKGIAINGLNPFTVMLWITVLGSVVVGKRYEGQDFFMFMAGLMATVVSSDLVKAYMAHRISKVLNPRVLHIIDIILGVIFILLSIRLFYYGFTNYMVR